MSNVDKDMKKRAYLYDELTSLIFDLNKKNDELSSLDFIKENSEKINNLVNECTKLNSKITKVKNEIEKIEEQLSALDIL